MKKVILVSVAFVAMLPITAAARVGVFVGPRFAPYGWYGSYYGMYPYGPYFSYSTTGEVKLDTKLKDAEVFINGSYAGTAAQLKTMTMGPGSYDIEVRAPGRISFQQVYVVAGKTMKLHPDLSLEKPTAPSGS
jgi:opacity protein-like surface antigen